MEGSASTGVTGALPGVFGRYGPAIASALSGAVPEGSPLLRRMQAYHLGLCEADGSPSSGGYRGKALRPTLCLLCCEALGGDWSTALPAAVSLELVHNFSLIHDDIQDQDRERRHRPTVWALWGVPQALVAGDAMRALADRACLALASRGVPLSRTLLASRLITEASLQMIEGQVLDISYEARNDVTTDEYLAMIDRKTGALIRASAQVGALLAREDAEMVEAFGRFGFYLGRAFQVRDDFLGVWGDERATGKPAGSDLRRKKKSFPIVYALEKGSPDVREAVLRIYSMDSVGDGEVARLLEALNDAGAGRAAEEVVDGWARRALEALAGVPITPRARRELEELTEFLAYRQF